MKNRWENIEGMDERTQIKTIRMRLEMDEAHWLGRNREKANDNMEDDFN